MKHTINANGALIMSSGTGIAFELSSSIAKRSLITKGTQETPKGRHFRWRGHHFRSWKLREKGTFQVFLQYINAWYIKLISDFNSNLSETSFATICCCVGSGDLQYCTLLLKVLWSCLCQPIYHCSYFLNLWPTRCPPCLKGGQQC